MISEPFAMVADDHQHEGAAAAFQCRHDAPQLLDDKAHFGAIGIAQRGACGLSRCGVGRMGVEQMQPQELWCRAVVQFGQGAVGRRVAAAFKQ